MNKWESEIQTSVSIIYNIMSKPFELNSQDINHMFLLDKKCWNSFTPFLFFTRTSKRKDRVNVVLRVNDSKKITTKTKTVVTGQRHPYSLHSHTPSSSLGQTDYDICIYGKWYFSVFRLCWFHSPNYIKKIVLNL